MDGSPGRYTLDELVERAGASRGFVERLRDLGLITPTEDGAFRVGDVRRIRLVEACDRAGIGAETIGEACRAGSLDLAFLDAPQYQWSELRNETYGEFAERIGVPFEVIRAIGAVLVNRQLSPRDRTREDDEALFTPMGMIAPRVEPDALVRIARVYTDGLRRIAAAEADLFQTYLVGGLMEDGASYAEANERSTWYAAQIAPLVERMLVTLYRRQQEPGWIAGIVEAIERAVEESGAQVGPARPPAFAFIDLAGYTAITDQQGDAAAARLARELSMTVDRIVADHDGTPVKWLGDGVMVHFRHPGNAVRATLETVAAAPRLGLPAHAGVAAGPVVMQDGDYFGRAVNLASRLSAAAAPGQTLVAGPVVELTDDPALSFRRLDPLALKGFADRIEVFEARSAG